MAKPLKGSGVLLLREELGPEKARLKRLGAKVFHAPLLRRKIINVKISSLDTFDWIVFTSASGVGAFKKLGKTIPKSCNLGCVGTETAKELQKVFKRKSDFIPKHYTTEAFAREFNAGLDSGLRRNDRKLNLLLIRSANADTRMEAILRKRGYQARRISIYRVEPAGDPNKLKDILSLPLSYIFFGAKSQVEAWNTYVSKGVSEWLLSRGTRFMAIGPEASKALLKEKLAHTSPVVHTFDGMIDLLVKQWKTKK